MSTRRHWHPWLFGLVSAVILALPILAQGGLLDGWLDHGKDDTFSAVHFDRQPPLVFGAGALSVDLVGRWTVGNLSLTFDDDSKIRQGRQTMTAQALRLGQNAVVMGYRLGDGSVRVRRLSVRTTAQNIGNSGGGGADAGAVGELSGDVPN